MLEKKDVMVTFLNEHAGLALKNIVIHDSVSSFHNDPDRFESSWGEHK